MLVSLAFRHPVLPRQLATKEVQSCRYIKELKACWLKKKVEEGILEKIYEKRNCQLMSAGCFELVALLFVPAWLPRRLACWRWWQGAWLRLHCDVAHMFLTGTQEWCIPSRGSVQPVGPGWAQLEAQEVPKGSTNRSLTRRESISCAAFWALFRSWLLWFCTPSISPAALWWGEMAIRPFNIIINLVDSSLHPQLPYGCSFDLVLKEPGATFCPLSWFWTSLPLLQIKNNSGMKLVYNKKCNHYVYPTYEPPEWKYVSDSDCPYVGFIAM